MAWIRVFLLSSIFIFNALDISATHIVGGEFQLQHLSNSSYTLKLFLYNDDVNGNPEAVDPEITVHMWDRRNNERVLSVVLPLQDRIAYPYRPEGCNLPPLGVSRVEYSTVRTFSAAVYSSSRGYYFTYERCCRNNVINNIVSPEATGQTFYMEVPPFSNEDSQYINSTPALPDFPVDYLQLNKQWVYDLKATDADGDELRYSLVNPLAGNSSQDQPVPDPPQSAPYEEVSWASGYSLQRVIPGEPSLKLTGSELSVIPTKTGLFVVAIKVEEYRAGKKIGEVRREFQLVVYAPANKVPALSVERSGTQVQGELPVIVISTGQQLVLDVFGSDPDGDRIALVGRGQGFSFSSLGMQFVASSGVGEVGQVFSWQPRCDQFNDALPKEFEVTFTVNDENLCGNPGSVSQSVLIKVEIRPDFKPEIFIEESGVSFDDDIQRSLIVGESLQLDVVGADRNIEDELFLELIESDLPVENFPQSGKGLVLAPFALSATCELLQGQFSRELNFKFRVSDNGCLTSSADTISLNILIEQPVQAFEEVHFPNMFSPNNDGFNDSFYINNLPEDVCTSSFQYIKIFNRWGKTIYLSTDKNFNWAAENVSDGVYYYEIRYTNGWSHESFLALMRGKSNISGIQNP